MFHLCGDEQGDGDLCVMQFQDDELTPEGILPHWTLPAHLVRPPPLRSSENLLVEKYEVAILGEIKSGVRCNVSSRCSHWSTPYIIYIYM